MPRLVTSPWSSHQPLLRNTVKAASAAGQLWVMLAQIGARIKDIRQP
jgi:hypothetical protein